MQEVLNKMKDKSINYNIFRIQDDYSVIFCSVMILVYRFHRTYAPRINSVILYQKGNMAKENVILDFRFKKEIDETRNYLLEEIKHSCLMSEKHKKSAQGLKLH